MPLPRLAPASTNQINITLSTLDLSWNSVRMASGVALGQSLAHNSALMELKLAHNSIADAGTQAVRSYFFLVFLKRFFRFYFHTFFQLRCFSLCFLFGLKSILQLLFSFSFSGFVVQGSSIQEGSIKVEKWPLLNCF